MSDVDPKDFLAMSVALTGFTKNTLSPGLDPADLNGVYLTTAIDMTSEAEVQELVARYTDLAGQEPKLSRQQIADELLMVGAPKPDATAQLAQSIVAMWYLANWYPPGKNLAQKVVSQTAYTRGLAWRAAQAHPMGYSEFKFGYWGEKPPSLEDFGLDTGADSTTGGES